MLVPGYDILGELGRGGMGVVYKARQVKANRIVALKMILSGAHADETDLARFRTEAEAIARLQHPHIVQVYEVGEHDGKPFFSLEFCAGGSLNDRLDGTPLQPKEAAQLVETLARAMQAAHEKNVIHRDLKPANVLLAEDGQLKISDFGLAKKTDEGAGQTVSGSIVGTPSYMAPEQADGRSREVGPAADVYALGAILYELLTGRPPFKAATPLDTALQVIRDEPVPPRRLQPKTPTDLETICLKCLHKEPKRRYATARDLAEDLERFQAGRPVQARPVGLLEGSWRWCRRNPAVAGLLAAVAVVLLLGTAVAWTFALEAQANSQQARNNEATAQREKQDAETARKAANDQKELATQKAKEADQQRQRAEEQLDRARRHLFTAQLARAAAIWDTNPSRARELLHDYDKCPIDLRDFVWQLYDCACRNNRKSLERTALKGHTFGVGSVAFSSDGQTLASGSIDGTIKLWDVKTGKERASLTGYVR
jgi:serine/threonine protein kinase